MRTWKIRGAAAAIVVAGVFAASEAAAAGFSNSSHSATSGAMAGVGVANLDEPNSSFHNAALMTRQEGFRAYAGAIGILPSTVFRPADEGDAVRAESNFFTPPNLHAAYGFNDQFAVGVGLTVPYGLGIEWPDGWTGRETIQSQQLQTFDINPNVAYEIPGTALTLAAGGQVVLSSIEQRRSVVLRDDTEIDVHLGGVGQGFGATAGVAYQPTESLTFGANYRSAVRLDMRGRARFDGEEGTPFADQFVDGAVQTSVTLPHTATAGVGWRTGDLFLELDLQYATWHVYDQIAIDFENDKPRDESVVEANWRDSGAVRFGGEYRVAGAVPIRFGVGWDASPIPDETVSASLPGNHRAIGSVGTGYTIAGIRADIGYQIVAALPREIENETSPNGTYRTTAHLFSASVGYGF